MKHEYEVTGTRIPQIFVDEESYHVIDGKVEIPRKLTKDELKRFKGFVKEVKNA